MNRAVFLDRDGTLMEEVHYCSDPKDVRLLPGVYDALSRLKAAGYLLVVITNQSGIGRGYFTEEDYGRVHAELLRQCDPIDAAYYCPSCPELEDPRRKPSPGMILEAAEELEISLRDSFMIGDKEIDVQAGRNAGVRTILVRTGYGANVAASEADFSAANMSSAADWILESGRVPASPSQ